MTTPSTHESEQALDARQQAILPIAALAAAGDIVKLEIALNQGLDACLAISDAREVLVQLYAYAGFPRSLNALAELMQVLDARRQRGIQDVPGRGLSRTVPTGAALRAAGAANQTRLVGQPVRGPIFDFAPVMGEYLQSHLFGAIFERDNLDWASRELATVGMLSGLPGAEAQLQAHLRIGMNVGWTADQLRQAGQVLADRASLDCGQRLRAALAAVLPAAAG